MIIAGYDREPYAHMVTAEKLFSDIRRLKPGIQTVDIPSYSEINTCVNLFLVPPRPASGSKHDVVGVDIGDAGGNHYSQKQTTEMKQTSSEQREEKPDSDFTCQLTSLPSRSPSPLSSAKDRLAEVKDDRTLRNEPSQHIEYLSRDWLDEDTTWSFGSMDETAANKAERYAVTDAATNYEVENTLSPSHYINPIGKRKPTNAGKAASSLLASSGAESSLSTSDMKSTTTILIRKLPLTASEDLLRSMLLFSKDLIDASYVPPRYAEDKEFRTAIAHFKTFAGTQEARDVLNRKPYGTNEGEMIVELVQDNTPGTIGLRRNTVDDTSGHQGSGLSNNSNRQSQSAKGFLRYQSIYAEGVEAKKALSLKEAEIRKKNEQIEKLESAIAVWIHGGHKEVTRIKLEKAEIVKEKTNLDIKLQQALKEKWKAEEQAEKTKCLLDEQDAESAKLKNEVLVLKAREEVLKTNLRKETAAKEGVNNQLSKTQIELEKYVAYRANLIDLDLSKLYGTISTMFSRLYCLSAVRLALKVWRRYGNAHIF